MALFLGLDSSTQTLKATVIDEQLKEVYVQVINFDSDLPQFGTYLSSYHCILVVMFVTFSYVSIVQHFDEF